MNEADKRGLWALGFAALGVTAAGLALGLKRFLWRLWAALSFLWIGFWLFASWMNKLKDIADPFLWGIIVVPPLLVLLVAGLLAWIIDGLFGDVSDRSQKSTPPNEQPDLEQTPMIDKK